MNNREVVLYIAISLDGYIADSDGGISFLQQVEKDGEDYGYKEFSSSTDVVILGRKTWETVLSFNLPEVYSGKQVFVISKKKEGREGNVVYYGGDIPTLIRKLKSETGLNIHIDGGAEVVYTMLKDKLIDRIIVSVIPVLLGDGIRLFGSSFPVHRLKLKQCLTFSTGLVQLHYETEAES